MTQIAVCPSTRCVLFQRNCLHWLGKFSKQTTWTVAKAKRPKEQRCLGICTYVASIAPQARSTLFSNGSIANNGSLLRHFCGGCAGKVEIQLDDDAGVQPISWLPAKSNDPWPERFSPATRYSHSLLGEADWQSGEARMSWSG